MGVEVRLEGADVHPGFVEGEAVDGGAAPEEFFKDPADIVGVMGGVFGEDREGGFGEDGAAGADEGGFGMAGFFLEGCDFVGFFREILLIVDSF